MNKRKIKMLIKIVKQLRRLEDGGVVRIDKDGVLMVPEVLKETFTEFDVEDFPGDYYDTKIITIRDGVAFYSYANKEELK